MEQLKVMPPPIIVKGLYAPDERAYLREFLVSRKIDLDVGMWRLHAHITGLVHANRGRIIRETGITGIYVDQLSVRNLIIGAASIEEMIEVPHRELIDIDTRNACLANDPTSVCMDKARNVSV